MAFPCFIYRRKPDFPAQEDKWQSKYLRAVIHVIFTVYYIGCVKRKKMLSNMCKMRTDHPAHAQSIMQAFTFHSYILWHTIIVIADSEGSNQTARMRRLIWVFPVRIGPRSRFCWRGPYTLTYLYIKATITKHCLSEAQEEECRNKH